MFGVLGEVIILREYVNKFNAQVISGGKVSMKPGCCNCSDILACPPATKPPAPRARPLSGARHTQAR